MATPDFPNPDAAPTRDEDTDAAVRHIVSQGPRGAFAVAAISTAIVVAIYFAFYLFIHLPRGVVQ